MWRLRAFLLYHYLPFNKTIFGKLADPVYVLLVAFTMLPLFGVRFLFFGVLLVMLLYPGPPDEYQLSNYILHFKGTQFFTSGVIMTFVGAMQQYSCYLLHDGDLKKCLDNHGPGATQGLLSLIVDYLGSVVLVWVAFLMLPRSTKHPRRACLRRASVMERQGVYCCCLHGMVSQGGKLRRLLRYDVVCFLLSLSVFTCSYALRVTQHDDDHDMLHLKAALYWGNCLYALLSLPFSIFVVPVFAGLLTHSVTTGFDEDGILQEFALEEETEASEKDK